MGRVGVTTKVDELTGTPFPIIQPFKRELPLNNNNEADWHHGWHPSDSPVFATAGGWALRNSMLQLTDRRVHNNGPHSYHPLLHGPELPKPEEEDKQFDLTIPGCAGFISEYGYDLWNLNTEPVLISPRQREVLTKLSDSNPHEYRNLRYNYPIIRSFYGQYVVKQDISHIDERVKLEMVTTSEEEKYLRLGDFILKEMVGVAVDRVGLIYKQAHDAGLLHPAKASTARQLVIDFLGTREQRELLYPQIVNSIMREIEGESDEDNPLQTGVNELQLAA